MQGLGSFVIKIILIINSRRGIEILCKLLMEIFFQHLNCLYAPRCLALLALPCFSRFSLGAILCFMQTNYHAYTLITMLHIKRSRRAVQIGQLCVEMGESAEIYKLRAFFANAHPLEASFCGARRAI